MLPRLVSNAPSGSEIDRYVQLVSTENRPPRRISTLRLGLFCVPVRNVPTSHRSCADSHLRRSENEFIRKNRPPCSPTGTITPAQITNGSRKPSHEPWSAVSIRLPFSQSQWLSRCSSAAFNPP